MSLTRKTAQILYRLLLVVWVSAFAFGAIEGCLAQGATAFGVLSGQGAPVVTVAAVDHDDSSAEHGMVCKRFCQAAATPIKFEQATPPLSASVFPLLLWVMLPCVTVAMAARAKPAVYRTSSAATGIAAPPYLLFQRFNN